MTGKELRRRARSINADVLANRIGEEATAVRRWIAGGINSSVEGKVRKHFGEG